MLMPRTLPLVFLLSALAPLSATAIDVGFGAADVSPALVDGHPVWLAGLEHNRAATSVHDSLWARAIVLRDHGHKVGAGVGRFDRTPLPCHPGGA